MNRSRKLEFHHVSGLFLIILIVLSIILMVSKIPLLQKNASTKSIETTQMNQDKTVVGTEPSQKQQKETKKDYSREFNKHLTGGMELFRQGRYSEALLEFQSAEHAMPNDPRINYLMMICQSNIEKKPYSENSETLRLARRMIVLAPDKNMASEAMTFIWSAGPVKLDKGVSFDGHSPKKQKKPLPKVKTPAKKKPSIPELKKKHAYPKAKKTFTYAKRESEKPAKIPSIEKPLDLREMEMKTVTLTGNVTRLDEKGRSFNPAGSRMVLLRINGSERYETTVDKNGDYIFTGVNPSSDYILVCVSDYKYTGYVEQYNVNYPYYSPYYNPNYRPPYNESGIYYNNGGYYRTGRYYQYSRTSSGLRANVTIGESRRHPGSFRIKRANVTLNTSTSSGGYYYTPTGSSCYYGYPSSYGGVTYSEGTYLPPGGYTQWVPVEQNYDVSWHLRMDLQKGGLYRFDLTQGNADDKFVPAYEPEYDPVTHQYFQFVRDVKLRRIES